MGCTQAELFVYTLLGAVYAALAVFSIVRCRKILTLQWRQAQIFYVLLVLQCAFRAATLILACDVMMHSTYVIFLTTPDSVFIVSYLMMFWQLLTLFYYSHFDHDFETHFFREVSQKPQQSSTSMMFLFFLIVWIGTQFALVVACLLSRIDNFSVEREVAVGNLVIPSLALLSMVCFQIKYSGRPLRGPVWRAKLVKMNLVFIIWSVGRLFSGSLSIASNKEEDINKPSSTYRTELIVIYLVASEILCIVLVLDLGFLKLFQLGEREEPEPLAMSSQQLTEEESQFSILSISPTISPLDLTVLSELPGRKHGLGILRLGRFKEKEVVCRRLDFPRSSHFVIESLTDEIQQLQELHVWGLLPYYGAVLQPPSLTIVSPYMTNGSLYDLLHDVNKRQRLQTKLSICQKTAHTMAQLVTMNMHHGHLSSHNILLDSRLNPFISDFGFARLKKYATITLGYVGKNSWSSPEVLGDRAAAVMNISEKDDIYSFGMVLWEAATEREPFPGVPWQQLAELVSVESLRPEIPGNVPSVVSQLILSCWNAQAEKRPTFALVESTLQQYLQGDL